MSVALTADMRAIIEAAHLCFAATVSPAGMRSVSPKGTIRVRDGQQLFFLDLASPGTRANLQAWPWDLFEAAGFSVGIFYLFAAILARQLGGLHATTLALTRGTAWAFALAFAAITLVSWRFLFILLVALSLAITVCLTAAAWLSARQVAP